MPPFHPDAIRIARPQARWNLQPTDVIWSPKDTVERESGKSSPDTPIPEGAQTESELGLKSPVI